MMKRINCYRGAVLTVLLSLCSLILNGQDVENKYQYRMGIEMDWSLVKGLKLSVEPQFRFDEGFSVDNIMVDAGLRYKVLDFLYVGANYRVTIEPNGQFDTEIDGRYSFNVMARKKIDKFTTSLRVQYSNYSDDDITDKEFMRYRAMVKYNIPKSHFNPYISVEAFQTLEENLLYKMRYSAGFDYKVKKNRYLDFNYKLDFYALEYKNRHIFSIGYKFNF